MLDYSVHAHSLAGLLESMRRDFRFGIRMLRRDFGFTIVTVAILALGIGANTALMTVVNAVLLHRMPVREPDDLVVFTKEADAGVTAAPYFSFPLFERFQQESHSFSGLAAVGRSNRLLSAATFGLSDPIPVRSHEVNGDFFHAIGTGAQLGRVLTAADDASGQANPVVVISHGLWLRRFGADPSIIGRTIEVDQLALTIVGVAQAGFSGVIVGDEADLWLPMQIIPQIDVGFYGQRLKQDTLPWLILMARLKSGMDLARVKIETDLIYQRENRVMEESWAGLPQARRRELLENKLVLRPGGAGYNEHLLGQLRPLLTLVAGIALLVLLVACANVACLLLARGAARRRELSVRVALGASRTELVRQLVIESLVLALLGGLAGVWIATLAARFLMTQISRVGDALDFTPDLRVLGFTVAASLVTGIGVGLIPALRACRFNVVDALKEQSSGNTGSHRQRLTRVLVVTQIAVSVCLLSGAGLFIQTLRNLRNADTGFNPRHLMVFGVTFPRNYEAVRRTAAFRDFTVELKALPGVLNATFSQGGLRNDTFRQNFSVVGDPVTTAEPAVSYGIFVGPDFLSTMGIRLLKGEPLSERAIFPISAPNLTPCLINESLARKYFGNEEPVGRHLKTGRAEAQIVGVVADTKYKSLREESAFVIYHPYYLNVRPGRPGDARMTFQVRAAAEPKTIASSVHALARRIDSTLLVSDVSTMEEIIASTLGQERSIAQTTALFGGIALLLASIGLYGTLVYDITRRTREIGVRLALGAAKWDVVYLVLRQGLAVTLVGCFVGGAGSLILLRLVSARLYGVAASAPFTLVATFSLLLVVACVACLVPARRALAVDPLVALRSE